jgi:hypothetical protein
MIITQAEVMEMVSKQLATKGILVRTNDMEWTSEGVFCVDVGVVKRRNPTDEELIRLEKEGWNRGEVAKMFGRCRQSISDLYSDLYLRTGLGNGKFTGAIRKNKEKR